MLRDNSTVSEGSGNGQCTTKAHHRRNVFNPCCTKTKGDGHSLGIQGAHLATMLLKLLGIFERHRIRTAVLWAKAGSRSISRCNRVWRCVEHPLTGRQHFGSGTCSRATATEPTGHHTGMAPDTWLMLTLSREEEMKVCALAQASWTKIDEMKYHLTKSDVM